MRNNCIMGNDNAIVPVVAENSQVEVASNFVQRNKVMATACEFVSMVAGGSLYSTTIFETNNYTCIPSDATYCSASTLAKVFDKIPCIDSLQQIFDNESSSLSSGHAMDDEWSRTYILCSNTTYSAQSSPAIIIGRSNVRILCGPNGKSLNKCVIQGGEVQLSLQDFFHTGGPPVTDSHVRGLTFADASYINVHSAFQQSQVEFYDCIFRVRTCVHGIHEEKTRALFSLEYRKVYLTPVFLLCIGQQQSGYHLYWA